MNQISLPPLALAPLVPLIVAAGGAILVLLADLVPRLRGQRAVAVLAGCVLAALGLASVLAPPGGSAYGGMVQDDFFARFFNLVFAVAGLLTVLVSGRHLREEGRQLGEYYSLLLFSVSGMVVMALARNLLLLYLGIELMALPTYVLVAFLKRVERSGEAGMKYYILGSAASGFLLFGISLIYGLTGSLAFPAIARAITISNLAGDPALLLGLLFVLVAFAFKVAAVPFHLWTPDVYEGAPTPVAGFLSVAAKAAALAALVRLLVGAFPDVYGMWAGTVAVLAVLTMAVGNLVAVVQKSVKRMLAYSSISHAGYLLVGLAVARKVIPPAGLPDGLTAILFYFAGYTFANIGAFAILTVLGREGRAESYADFKGFGHRHPLLAAAMAIFLLSLAGIPLTAGFVGKFYVFGAAVAAGAYSLAVIGVLSSAISLYYYMGVVMAMYMSKTDSERPVVVSRPLAAALAIMVALTLLVGVLPSVPLAMARRAVTGLFL